mmetsp:Transcript_17022/g.16250  ORF Transcript_17022/g.16250 Transcript_17022/m.16250 type:complete len:89 (+) Transcript_17022:476-742(+)
MTSKTSWISTNEGTQLTFEHTFLGTEKDHWTYIAFTYPFSYQETINFFDKIQRQARGRPEEVYFHRELLAFSLEKRFVELITLTGTNK